MNDDEIIDLVTETIDPKVDFDALPLSQQYVVVYNQMERWILNGGTETYLLMPVGKHAALAVEMLIHIGCIDEGNLLGKIVGALGLDDLRDHERRQTALKALLKMDECHNDVKLLNRMFYKDMTGSVLSALVRFIKSEATMGLPPSAQQGDAPEPATNASPASRPPSAPAR